MFSAVPDIELGSLVSSLQCMVVPSLAFEIYSSRLSAPVAQGFDGLFTMTTPVPETELGTDQMPNNCSMVIKQLNENYQVKIKFHLCEAVPSFPQVQTTYSLLVRTLCSSSKPSVFLKA